MDRTALRRAQRALRRPRHVGSLATAVVVGVLATIALPSAAPIAVPIAVAGAAMLALVAWPLGPGGTTGSLRREPTLPE
ncbi:hypothetical protein [Agrococcus sp. SGAir0287]|uniref:hypothetical protein n=1 Tax=Agrococcus sp. SGAir0287 TaxID=2070347 RepID=UPI0010FA509F|nr:hypothetical protein [Agrococcus sp. SGAir0287]